MHCTSYPSFTEAVVHVGCDDGACVHVCVRVRVCVCVFHLQQAENAHVGHQLEARLAALSERSAAINEEEGLFGWDKTDWPQVSEIVREGL